jgi:hypothetical protein
VTLPDIRIEIGFTSTLVADDIFVVGDPERGKVGIAEIGPDAIWVRLDNATVVQSWSFRRGVNSGDQPTRRYEPGTATVVLHDPNRDFDPENLSGPYVTAGITEVEPERRLRILAEWNGTVYPLFYGYVDDWSPDYQGSFWTYVTVTATDGSKLLDKDRPLPSLIAGSGEYSGARIGRILTSLGWPTADRQIDTGAMTLQGTELSGNGMSELQLVQDTELGEFFINPDGKATFRDRLSMLTDPRSTTSQATFGDGGYDATGELPYADTKMSSLVDGLVNSVTITRVGGTPQQATDTDSIARYMERTFERTDLLQMTDVEALSHAEAVLYRHRHPDRRFAEISFLRPSPDMDDVMWPTLLGREFGDRITILRRPAGGGDPIQQDCFIRGVRMASDGERWDTAFVLESAHAYSFFTVGHPELGQVGVYPVSY